VRERGRKGREKKRGKGGNYRKEKRKIEKEIEKRNEGRVLWAFHLFIHVTRRGEVVLPKVSVKLIRLHQRIRFTNTVIAKAATATGRAMPNAPYI
jgi:hypothetical protein